MKTILFIIILLYIGCPKEVSAISAEAEKAIKLADALVKRCFTLKNLGIKPLILGKKCLVRLDKYKNCYPATKANTMRKLECSPFKFEPGYIERRCLVNGSWDRGKDNTYFVQKYCTAYPEHIQQGLLDRWYISINATTQKYLDVSRSNRAHLKRIYDLECGLRYFDFVVCLVGLMVLLYLLPIKNPRINLHRNLIFAFMMGDILINIRTAELRSKHIVACNVFFTMFQFFVLAQVTWMFNEGFFQFRKFFFVFVEKSYMWAFFLFGWGFPFVITFITFLPVMWYNEPYNPIATALNISICWDSEQDYKINYIVYTPMYLLLLMNMMLLSYLMYIIWSKLKVDGNNEVRRSRKAARGFFILLVLLGGGYVFTLHGPNSCIEFAYIRAVIMPTQGTLVCIFYVVLSREVREAAKNRLRKFTSKHNLDWGFMSPRFRSETSDTTVKRFSIFERRASNSSRRVSVQSLSQVGMPSIMRPNEARRDSDHIFDIVNEKFKEINEMADDKIKKSDEPQAFNFYNNVYRETDSDNVGEVSNTRPDNEVYVNVNGHVNEIYADV